MDSVHRIADISQKISEYSLDSMCPKRPSRDGVIHILEIIESLIFPGFQTDLQAGAGLLPYSISEKLHQLVRELTAEITQSLEYAAQSSRQNASSKSIRHQAETLALELAEEIPVLHERATEDARAAAEGDPAARGLNEIILSYPGFEAVTCHRIAHELYRRDIPLIPRIMSEHIHRKTGIDIHPGARIGSHFFIDHGTGVVIGETAVIGNRVKLYQGVTIGALSVSRDMADKKRHPTLEDDVTIYAGATILGGRTCIGKGSVIGGNVWITSSVPAHSIVYNRPADYRIKNRYAKGHDWVI